MSYFVIRPGETEFDAQSRIAGRLSLPLTAQGRLQVGQMIQQLKGTDLDVIYTSGTEPALATATALADALDTDVKVVEDLVNMDLGLWQGLLLDEIRTRQPRVFKQWHDSPDAVCPPQGETCEEAYARVAAALRKPLRRGRSFAVVCPEPLATIVSCVIRNCDHRSPGPMCGCAVTKRVEEIALPVPV
ncbi:MAG: histidine phosphatase family protein [Planctomycetaceae bacterium]|nr:histidine phosphatase family protein [Planctomycetaceae bacterium]